MKLLTKKITEVKMKDKDGVIETTRYYLFGFILIQKETVKKIRAGYKAKRI